MQKLKIILFLIITCAFLFNSCQSCPKGSGAYVEKDDKTNWDENNPENTGKTLTSQQQFISGSISSVSDIDFFRVDAPDNVKKMSLEVCYKGEKANSNSFILVVRVYNKLGDFKRYYFDNQFIKFDLYYEQIDHLLIGVYGNPACASGEYLLYFKTEPPPTSKPTQGPGPTYLMNTAKPTQQPVRTENITLIHSIDVRLYIDEMAKQAASGATGWFIDKIAGKSISKMIAAILDPLDNEFLFPKIDVYKVNYKSVAADGKTPKILSGLILVPAGRSFMGKVKIPILGYTHGTTLPKKQAPSCFDPKKPFDTFEVLIALIYASYYGYVTAMPDYQGMGDDTDAVQPYMCKEPLSRAVADMLILTKEFLTNSAVIEPQPRNELSVAWNGQTYLSGYSQGGYVSLLSAKTLLEDNYKSLNLVACASGAGPHSLDTAMRLMMLREETYAAPYFMPMAIRGFYSTYKGKIVNGKDLGDYFTDEYAFAEKYQSKGDVPGIWAISDGNQSTDYVTQEIAKRMGVKINEIIPVKMLSDNLRNDMSNPDSDVYKILNENNSYDWEIPKSLAVRFFHSPQDDFVPYENSLIASANLDAPLVQAFLLPMGTAVHVEAAISAMLSSYTWFSDIRSIHSELAAGDFLQQGHELRSPSGNAGLRYQLDGSLKLYDRISGMVLWDAGAALPVGSHNYLTVMRALDGMLAVYDLHGNILWNSGVHGENCKLVVTDDKKLEIKDKAGKVVWSKP